MPRSIEESFAHTRGLIAVVYKLTMVAVPKTWVMKREVSARSSDKTEDGTYGGNQ